MQKRGIMLNVICGCGGIGRHDRLRIYCFCVQVQVLSSAPKRTPRAFVCEFCFAKRRSLSGYSTEYPYFLYRLYDAEPKSRRLFQPPRFDNVIITQIMTWGGSIVLPSALKSLLHCEAVVIFVLFIKQGYQVRLDTL